MTTKAHYDNHLAAFYSWMIGDFNLAKSAFRDFCIKNGIKPVKTGKAVDLGAGNGIQSIALAEIGFSVAAVDFNDTLLNELKARIGTLPIEPVEDEMTNFKSFAYPSVDLIVCCGDTLSHLDNFDQLDQLLNDSYELLTAGGRLILSFRDYSVALSGTRRFIPVKSDEHRILTCMLEYGTDKVTVTDLLHEKINGQWTQKVSSYDKLRIRTDDLIQRAERMGFSVARNENINRMMHLILEK